MLRQRVLGVVAGHEGRNDHGDPRDDPAFKFAADDRRPDGAASAGRPAGRRRRGSGTA